MRREGLYLRDIRDAIGRIEEYALNLSFAEYESQPIVRDAILFNLQVIGEAARNIPEEMRNDHPHIPWSRIVAARNKIVHMYFGLDDEVIWDIVKNHLSPLLAAVKALLGERDP